MLRFFRSQSTLWDLKPSHPLARAHLTRPPALNWSPTAQKMKPGTCDKMDGINASCVFQALKSTCVRVFQSTDNYTYLPQLSYFSFSYVRVSVKLRVAGCFALLTMSSLRRSWSHGVMGQHPWRGSAVLNCDPGSALTRTPHCLLHSERKVLIKQ